MGESLPGHMMYCAVDEKSILCGGNEWFYKFFGDNTYYPLHQSIEPEDVKRYFVLLEKASTQELFEDVLRLKDAQGKYHWVFFQIKKKIYASGETVYPIWFQEISEMGQNAELYQQEILKCRNFMGMMENVFFEYDSSTQQIQFYWIQGGEKILIQKEDYNDWKEICEKHSYIDNDSKDVFQYFCCALEEKREHFSYGINASFLNVENRCDSLKIFGETVVLNDGNSLVIGRIEVGKRLEDSTVQLETIKEKTDSLTGLLNKGQAEALAKKKIEEAGECGKAICIIDVDDFKQFNDDYGHLFGDEVLRSVAELLRKAIGEKGICGRFGGDEFFVMVEDDVSEKALRMLWSSIRSTVQWLFQDRIKEIQLSISVGISRYPIDGTTYKELFLKADRALYLAKEKGKNRYIIYDEKRHGNVDMTGEDDIALEFSRRKREENKTKGMCKVIQLAQKRGQESINEILKLLGECFAVDRITVMQKDGWKRKYQWSRTGEVLDTVPYMEEEAYLELFDENGDYACNYIMHVDGHSHNAYLYLQRHSVYSMYQHLFKKEGQIYLISYDSCFAKRKWSEADIHDLTIMNTVLEGLF